ncbi:hypothetical protein [Rhizosaccharibacter radicis]|uniref:AsnC family protein n=1 Tax=Rhizosaccharibacter radicis TaxID=2782605 RepID=A0ABT1W1L0_9PROT|nr:hypothetical protein [Acetobacteraceae bacterium KSS12]
MPRALDWTDDQDERLVTLIQKKGATLRQAAFQMGVSRSFAQRRAKMLSRRFNRSTCSAAREEAGEAPLLAGHPITWNAINGVTHTMNMSLSC